MTQNNHIITRSYGKYIGLFNMKNGMFYFCNQIEYNKSNVLEEKLDSINFHKQYKEYIYNTDDFPWLQLVLIYLIIAICLVNIVLEKMNTKIILI
ncbi:hypothetical protein KHQ88_06315 [Mycoplasmatota bacterium]|nr:hypothetical protein KHQ88_06315 [Mycoplasmatota bacterium]